MHFHLGKTLTMIALAAALALPVTTSAGEKSLGLRAGYNTRNESGVAGLYFQYAFSRHFRLAPNADYVFRNHGTDAFSFNINAQFPIAFDANERWAIYPLTGLNVISWNHRLNNTDGTHTGSRLTRLGLNAGVGLEYKVTRSLKLHAEGKFSLVRSYSSGVFNLGIGYVF